MQPWNDESFSNYDSKTQNQQRKRLIDLATLQKKKKKKKKKKKEASCNKNQVKDKRICWGSNLSLSPLFKTKSQKQIEETDNQWKKMSTVLKYINLTHNKRNVN